MPGARHRPTTPCRTTARCSTLPATRVPTAGSFGSTVPAGSSPSRPFRRTSTRRPRLSPDGDRLLIVAEGDLRVYDLDERSREPPDHGRRDRHTMPRGRPPGQRSRTRRAVVRPARTSGFNRRTGAAPPGSSPRSRGGSTLDDWAPAWPHLHRASSCPSESRTTSSWCRSMRRTRSRPIWLGREFPPTRTPSFLQTDATLPMCRTRRDRREIHIRPFPGPGWRDDGVGRRWGRTGVGGERRAVLPATERQRDDCDRRVDRPRAGSVGPPTELFVRSAAIGGGGPRARYAVTADGQRFLMSSAQLPSAGTRRRSGERADA